MSSERGRVIVISGPTASGKSTLWRHLVSFPQVTFSVSATTRQMRDDEVDGRDYRFVDAAEFSAMADRGEFLEWAEVHGHCYGTLRSDVVAAVDSGKDILLEIDVQGAAQLGDTDFPVVSIFVSPPSLDELRQRLVARGTESVEEMDMRMSIVEQEMCYADEYDYVVVNDELERMIAEVESILGLEVAS